MVKTFNPKLILENSFQKHFLMLQEEQKEKEYLEK